jgi:hypothetical protein
MEMFKKIYKNIYSLPALVLHELSHIIVSVILGGKLENIEVKGFDVVRLKISNLKSIKAVRIVAMAPVIVPILFLVLGFINTYFFYGVVYSATVFRTTLPTRLVPDKHVYS